MVVSWAAKKQPSISLSSTESEYMATTLATCEAVFLQQFLIELGFHPPGPIPIFVDNQLAITLTCNPEFHAHTKHIEVCHHYICEKLKDKVIDLKYIPTDDQVVDIFIKPFQMVKYSRSVKGLSLS